MTKHGYSGSLIYHIWRAMLNRCSNSNISTYRHYGGRGIKVCKRWLDIKNFIKDMGEKPENMSLGRIDNNKGYFPSNCRWETHTQQANNKRTNRMVEYRGQTLTVTQWARKLKIKSNCLWARLHKGWSMEKTLSTPIRKRSRSY